MSEELLKKWQSQLRKGSLELCILGLIGQSDTYAFAMIQALQTAGQTITEGALYPLLKRLQKEDLVETYWCESESGPPRKYYRLSIHGQTILALMTAEWQDFSHFVNDILKGENSADTIENRSPQKVPLEIGKATSDPAQRGA